MKRYKLKNPNTHEVTAILVNIKDELKELQEFLGDTKHYFSSNSVFVVTSNLMCELEALNGTYLIRGLLNDYYVMSKDDFENFYIEVDSETD